MSAAVAMLISLAVFTTFNKYVAEAAVKVEPASHDEPVLSAEESRSRVITLIAIFIISMVFWLAFYQIFYTFTFWARDNTATNLNPETFQVFEPLGVILLVARPRGPVDVVATAQSEPSTPVKMLGGVMLVAIAFGMLAFAAANGGDHGRVSAQWLIWANVIIALGEISLSPMGLSLVNKHRAAAEPRADDGRLVRQPRRLAASSPDSSVATGTTCRTADSSSWSSAF